MFDQLPIESIVVKERKRPINDIGKLAESINNLGLLNPITVVMRTREPGGLSSDSAPVLLAGLRRLEACKSLGWKEIPAQIVEIYDLDLELAEIDENLIRDDLNALQRSEQLQRRKWIYEQKYPETRAGVAGGKARQNSATDIVSFAENTAESTGYDARSVRREVAIAAGIPKELRDELRETDQADSQEDLKALANAKKDPERQRKAVKAVVSGEAKNLRQALKTEPRITESEQSKALGELASYLQDCGVDPEIFQQLCKPLEKKNPAFGKIVWRMKRAA